MNALEPLTDSQLLTLMQHGPMLDRIATRLPEQLQQQLLDIQRRAGDAYNVGDWVMEGSSGVVIHNPPVSAPPTRGELQEALGQAYLALEGERTELKTLIDALELTPYAVTGETQTGKSRSGPRPSGW